MAALLCGRYGCRLRESGETFLLEREGKRIRLSARHLRDLVEVARHFDIYFAQVVPTIVRGRREVDYSQPRLHTLHSGLPFELSGLPDKIPLPGSYFRAYKPVSGDLVFDIGAYCGVLTYELSQLVGAAGTVIAFEPDPVNVQLLRRNVERHRMNNVRIVELALSGQNGTAPFRSDGSRGSVLHSPSKRPSSGKALQVETVTLEEACRRYGMPQFLKMDAGGSEVEILSESQRFLRSRQMHFVLDTSHIRYGATTHGPVESIFENCRYCAESNAEPGGFMTTWAAPASLPAGAQR